MVVVVFVVVVIIITVVFVVVVGLARIGIFGNERSLFLWIGRSNDVFLPGFGQRRIVIWMIPSWNLMMMMIMMIRIGGSVDPNQSCGGGVFGVGCDSSVAIGWRILMFCGMLWAMVQQ